MQGAANSIVAMQAGESIVIDPTFREEAAASGVVTIIVNTNSDICAIRKASGVGIPLAQVCAEDVLSNGGSAVPACAMGQLRDS